MNTEKKEIELNEVPWGVRFWHEGREYVVTGSHKDQLVCFNITKQDGMIIDTLTMVEIFQSDYDDIIKYRLDQDNFLNFKKDSKNIKCPISVEKITEDICDIMKKHSPDGRFAGAEFITGYIIEILNQQKGKGKMGYIDLERILDLPFGELKKKRDTPEVKALMKIIETYPFILDVADNKYDPEYANMSLIKDMFEKLNTSQLVEIFKNEESPCKKGKGDPNCEDKWHVKGNPETDTCPTCGMGFAKD